MKFSELLDEYLALREEIQSDDYYDNTPIPSRTFDRERLDKLKQQLDEIVEGVNRAEKT